MRSTNTKARLAALEAIADQLITTRMAALETHYERIVGLDVLREADALADQCNRHELSEEVYQQRYAALFAPFRSQLANDPALQAVWETLWRAIWYQKTTARYKIRGKIR